MICFVQNEKMKSVMLMCRYGNNKKKEQKALISRYLLNLNKVIRTVESLLIPLSCLQRCAVKNSKHCLDEEGGQQKTEHSLHSSISVCAPSSVMA